MWVTPASSLSRSLWAFLYSSSVLSLHHFLISSASVKSLIYCTHLCMKCSSGISAFLEEIYTFTILLFSSNSCTIHLWRLSSLSLLFSGSLHSTGYIFPFLLCLSLLLFSQVFLSPPQATTLPSHFCFPWGWFWRSPPIQCYKPPSIVLQANRPNPLNLFLIPSI